MCVANTHVHSSPELSDVKLWQVHTLLKGLEKIAASARIPMLLAGDFNSLPGSAPHELLVRGAVRSDHPDLAVDPLGILRPASRLVHGLPLASAYAAVARAQPRRPKPTAQAAARARDAAEALKRAEGDEALVKAAGHGKDDRQGDQGAEETKATAGANAGSGPDEATAKADAASNAAATATPNATTASTAAAAVAADDKASDAALPSAADAADESAGSGPPSDDAAKPGSAGADPAAAAAAASTPAPAPQPPTPPPTSAAGCAPAPGGVSSLAAPPTPASSSAAAASNGAARPPSGPSSVPPRPPPGLPPPTAGYRPTTATLRASAESMAAVAAATVRRQEDALGRQKRRLDPATGEPRFTHVTRDFAGTLDYLLYSADALVPVATLELAEAADVRSRDGMVGLPNERWPSDHTALAAEFAFVAQPGEAATEDVEDADETTHAA